MHNFLDESEESDSDGQKINDTEENPDSNSVKIMVDPKDLTTPRSQHSSSLDDEGTTSRN